MTPEQLRAAVHVVDGALTLAVADLGWTEVAAALGPFLTDGRLTLTAVEPPVSTADGLTLHGTGAGGAFTGMGVDLALASDGTQVHATVTGTGSSTWSFADAFPVLAGTLLATLRFSAPRVTLTSTDVSPPGPRLAFTGTLVIGTRVAYLDLLMPGATHTISGGIGMAAGLPEIDPDMQSVPDVVLDGPQVASLDLGLFTVEQVRYQIFGDPRLNFATVEQDVVSYLRLSWLVPFTVGGTRHQIPVAAELGLGSDLLFTGDFSDAGELRLADVARAIGNDLAIPLDFDIAAAVRFTEFHLLLTPTGKSKVGYVSLRLETQEQWTLVPDLLLLQEIDVVFRIDDPTAHPQPSAVVTGLLAIGESGTLELTAVPRTGELGGMLRDGDPPLSIREVWSHFLHSDPAHLPDLTVDVFDFALTLPDAKAGRTLAYSADLAVVGAWQISDVFDIVDVRFRLEHAADTSFDAAAILLIDQVRVNVEASYDSASGKGWVFSGSTAAGESILIGGLIDSLAQRFGALPLPAPLAGLTVKSLAASFTTGEKRLTLAAEIEFPLGDATVDLTVEIDTADRSFGGHLLVEVPVDGGSFKARFDIRFAPQPDAELFLATYSHRAGDPVPTVQQLVAAFSPSAGDLVPPGIHVDVRDVVFAFDRKGLITSYLFGVDIDASIDLSGLPLVGSKLGAGQTVGVSPLQLLAATGPIAAADVTALNGLLPPGDVVHPLPVRDLAAGFAVDAVLRLGSLTQPLALPTSPTGPAATSPRAPVVPPTKAVARTDDNVLWYKIQRTFGPITFERLGVAYEHPPGAGARLAFLVDGSLGFAGLVLSFDGLSIGFSLSDLAAVPSFALKGLGLNYTQGPVQITGAFLAGQIEYAGKTYPSYSGKAIVRTDAFSLGAIGSYAQLDQGPSMFVYAFLDYPIGGPAFFFVRGLALGFGYNRRFIAPAVSDIATFPLVAEVVGQEPSGSLGEEMARLQPYLPPSVGDYFLAIGIRFTTFEMVDTFLLLSLAFGSRFELNLLGLSTLVLPAADAASAGTTPIAEVQLALRATLAPDDGYFALSAQLTQNSFLLSRDCHLTGGFAFSTWFGTEHPGDFVLSVGGYSPRFSPPAHYPSVPRLGFNWQVSDQLVFKGSAYFALTPSMLMAGGSLSAVWQDGSLTAWFDASMDFLIAWKPYHYEAGFSISIGAQYTFSFFGSHTISVHIGADVQLWGPEFSGVAVIDLDIVSFTIRFGADTKPALEPIPWSRFRESFLPEPGKIVTVALRGGAVGQASTGDSPAGSTDLGAVHAAGLVLLTDALIPSKAAHRGPADGSEVALSTEGATLTFGVGPVGLTSRSTFAASHRVELRRSDGSRVDDAFTFTPVRKNLPAALWGDTLAPSATGPQLVTDLLTGYAIAPHPPAEPAAPPSLPRAALQTLTALFTEERAFGWLAPSPFMPSAAGAAAREAQIAASLASPDPGQARQAILDAVLPGAIIDLAGFDPAVFLEAPQVAAGAPA